MLIKTKIICTIGPASDAEDTLRDMMLAGMNVARLNFSHGTHEEQIPRVERLKKIREEVGRPVALLLDTKGPEVRLGVFSPEPKVKLQAGKPFTLTTRDVPGTAQTASVSYSNLPQDVGKGSRILLDDGLIELEVENVMREEILCKVLNDGEISSRKSLNVPGASLNIPFISSKDRSDLRFAVENDFDFVAASFTRTAEDILQLREQLHRLGGDEIRIIAKIENAEGVANIDAILAVSDGIMVARGDLGVELPLEDIPSIQKRLIKKCYTAGKQVITATQMLESMIHNPRPTRAETSDVANAIYDETSAIMLSGETAAGQYPVEAVRTMAHIAEKTETDIRYKRRFEHRDVNIAGSITDAISHATCAAAHDLSASYIVTVTKSGETAKSISKYRPACPIIGFSPIPKVVRQMSLSWGVIPFYVEEKQTSDALLQSAVEISQAAGVLKEGDLVIITAGVPIGISGTTNMLRIHVVGDPV